MTSGDPQARRGSGWEAMHSTLAADAAVAQTLLYASGACHSHRALAVVRGTTTLLHDPTRVALAPAPRRA